MRLNGRVVGWSLVGLIALAAFGHFALGQWDSPIARLFNLDEEASFGTWFASFTAWVAATLALVAAWYARRRGGGGAIWWAGLGFMLLVLSIDEVAQVHEGISTRLGDEFRGVEDVTSAGTPIMGLVLLPFVLFGCWVLWRWATGGSRGWLVAGLAIFWLGAFGVEELEFMNFSGTLFLTEWMSRETGDFLLSGFQEVLELSGLALLVVGLIRHLASTASTTLVEYVAGDAGALESQSSGPRSPSPSRPSSKA